MLNRAFPLPVHPFNLNNEGVQTYAEWQYDKGADTIGFFIEKYTPAMILSGKIILDIGCGAAGKSLYYAASGASYVYGADIVPEYMDEALALAAGKGLSDKFSFILADASSLPLGDSSIDTIIMNDAMEHVASPQKVLSECARVLKTGGRVFINFPPYYHPYGIHLSDLIGIPWAHLFFSRRTLIRVYTDLAFSLPDFNRRMALRFSGLSPAVSGSAASDPADSSPADSNPAGPGQADPVPAGSGPAHSGSAASGSPAPSPSPVDSVPAGSIEAASDTGRRSARQPESSGMPNSNENPQITYINGMTIRRFNDLLNRQTCFKTEYRRDVPLRGFLFLPSRLPIIKEALTKMVVAVLVKI